MKPMIRVRAGFDRNGRSSAASLRTLLSAALLLTAVPAAGQIWKGWSGGPVLDYSYGVPLSITRDSGIVNRYLDTLSGFSRDHAPALGVRLRHPDLFRLDLFRPDRPVGLTLDLMFGWSFGSFTSDPIPLDEAVDNDGIPTRSQVEVSVTSPHGFLRLGGILDYDWFEFLRLGFGFWGQYRFASNFVVTESLVDERNVTFNNPVGARSRVTMTGPVLGSSRIRGGPSLAVTFPEILAPLVPQLTAQLDVAALADGLGARSLRGGFGVAWLFELSGSDDPMPEPVDQVPILASPRQHVREHAPALHASVALYSEGGADSTSASTIARRQIRRRVVPLVPEIYFDDNSATISDQYVQYERQAAREFSVRDLARSDAARIYHHVLNVIGVRLRQAPEARIEVEGSVLAGEPRALAMRRAEAVRAYLVDVWGVEKVRISVSAGSGRSELAGDDPRRRSVVISTSEPELFDPIVTSWIEEETVLPSIRFVPTVRSALGLRRWTLTALHGSTEVARYEGTTLDELHGVKVAFALGNDLGAGALPPLAAELYIEDLTGAVAVARGELPLARSTTPQSDAIREIVSVLVLPDRRAGSVDGLLQGVVGALRRGAVVSVLRSPSHEFAERPAARPDAASDAVAAKLRALIRARRIDATVVTRNAVADEAPKLDGVVREAYRGGVSIVIEQRTGAPSRLRP